MSLQSIHLRKLLAIIFFQPIKRRSALREDIRREMAADAGRISPGGDFYAPFWADAKLHVFGIADLRDSVERRVAANLRRGNLYPLLRDGFLLWWNQRRRSTNEPFHQGQSLKAHFPFPGLNAVVKIDSILSVRDGDEVERFVCPYFAPEPALSEEAARLGLWLLSRALDNVPSDQMRILDVIRGRTFSIDRTPLHGDEEKNFRHKYRAVLESDSELMWNEPIA